MNAAANKGHLEIIKFLYYNRHEGCTNLAIEDAISNGYFEVVKFLFSIGKKTKFGIALAAENEWFDIVKFLVNNRGEDNFVVEINLFLVQEYPEIITYLKENLQNVEFIEEDSLEEVYACLRRKY